VARIMARIIAGPENEFFSATDPFTSLQAQRRCV